MFTPPVESKVDGPLATLTLGTASGGTNWPGGSYDPETHTVYVVCVQRLPDAHRLGAAAEGDFGHELRRGHGRAGKCACATGPGENSGADAITTARARRRPWRHTPAAAVARRTPRPQAEVVAAAEG